MDPQSMISIGALIVSAFSVVYVTVRNDKKDSTDETSKMTEVIVKLENIGTGVSEIKSEINNLKQDGKENRESVIKMEQSLKAAWKQIDEIKDRIGIAFEHREA